MNNPWEILSTSDPFNSWWPIIIAVVVGVVTTIRAYCGGPHCPSDATITGKTVLITGGSSGIGLRVVVELIERGGRLIVATRDPKTTSVVVKQAIKKDKITLKEENLVIKYCDLTSLKSVREFVQELDEEPKIDILINNAGVAFKAFEKTEEGFETHLITNYLSHFLLTHLLIPKLKAAEEARVINISAQAHYAGDLYLDDMNIENDYSYNKAFAQSKLALVMMSRHMVKIFKGTNITINSMHPGLIKNTRQFQNSPISSSFMMRIVIAPWAFLFMKTPSQGAQTIIYMAVATDLRSTTGKYFGNCKIIEPSERSKNERLAEKLYQKSLQLTGLKN